MSMNLTIQGTFKNGKKRSVGVHCSKGLEYKNQFDSLDVDSLEYNMNLGKNSFKNCMENNRFTNINCYFLGTYCNNEKEVYKENIQFTLVLEEENINCEELIGRVNKLIKKYQNL